MVETKEGGTPPFKLQFHYIKGQAYREMVCHGAIGGETSQDLIWMALYTERNPIPRIVEYEIPGSHKLGDTIVFKEEGSTPSNIEARQGIIRHIEMTTYMSLDIAKSVHAWLGRHIENLEKKKADKK